MTKNTKSGKTTTTTKQPAKQPGAQVGKPKSPSKGDLGKVKKGA